MSIQRRTLTDGDVWDAALANIALGVPIYGGNIANFGNIPLIRDLDMSSAPADIKARFTGFTGSFAVTAGAGATVNIEGGTVTLMDGSNVVITPGVINTNITDGVVFLIINSLGVIVPTQIFPARYALLATVVVTAGVVSSVFSVPRNALTIRTNPLFVKAFGGVSVTDFTATNGQTINGLTYCRDFLVPGGVTLNVTRYSKIICRNFTCAGTIQVSTCMQGGTGYAGSLVRQIFPSVNGSGIGGGSGHNSAPQLGYGFIEQPFGSGGSTGLAICLTEGGFTTGSGGHGGGGLWVESNGLISVTGSIFANGSNASVCSISAPATGFISGASGGSGGTVVLNSANSVSLSVASTIQVRGGAGVLGVVVGSPGSVPSRGASGAGGQVVLISPVVQQNGTIDAGFPAYSATSGTTLGSSVSGSNGGAGGTNSQQPLDGLVRVINENPIGM